MLNIAVAGANGRMGQEIVKLLEHDQDACLVARLLRPKKNEAVKFPETPMDALIDFSTPQGLVDHLRLCTLHQIGLVVGMTGLSDTEKKAIETASLVIPIVWAPNMSIGVNICLKLLDTVASLLKGEDKVLNAMEVGIHEIHHKHKKDAPSGTALKMSEVISRHMNKKSMNEKTENAQNHDRDTSSIPISSMRLGEVPGEHTVLFALPGEQFEITHKASDRSSFARGAIQAAKWLVGKPPGLYDMQDVLGLRT